MKPLDTLTRQESVVLSLLARGWRNARIARELVISTRTVETHVYRIFSKLGVSTRTEATLYALYQHPARQSELRGGEIRINADDMPDQREYSLDA